MRVNSGERVPRAAAWWTRIRSPLWILAASLFTLRFGAMLTTVGLPLFVVARYGAGLEAGVTLAAQLLPSVLFGPVVGDVIDRSDPRRLAILGPLVTAPAVVLFPFTTALWQLQVLALLYGVGYMIGVPARMALRRRTMVPGQETARNGVLVGAQRTGTLLGPAASAPLVVLGFPTVFLGAAVASVFAAALLVFFPRRQSRSEEDTDGADEVVPAHEGIVRRLAADLRRVFLTGLPGLVRTVVCDRPLFALTVTTFTYMFGYGMTRLFLTAFALESNPDRPGFYGVLVAVMGMGAIVGSLLTGRLSRLPQGWLYLGVNVVEALCWVSIVLVDGLVPAVGLVALAGVAESIGTVVFYAEAQTRLPERMEGRFFSVLIPYTDAFVVIGSIVSGVVLSAGVVVSGWIIAAAMGLPTLLLAPFFLRRREWTRSGGDV